MSRQKTFFTWREGRTFDLWTIVHFFSGLVAGILFQMAGVGILYSIVIGLFFAIAWEGYEKFSGIGETRWNSFADVVIAGVAAGVSYYGFTLVPKKSAPLIFSLVIILWLILEMVGKIKRS